MSNTARVGLFMLVALVVLGVFIVKIEEIPIGTKGGRVPVKALFPSVAGLDEKSPVRVAGVRIGIVESISLQGDRALVTLALDPGVVLHEGATAEVASLGMLGDKYVELYPGNLSGPPLPRDAVLMGTSPVPFDEVMKNLNDIGGDVKSITASLRQSLGGTAGQKRLDEIIENIRELSADLKATVEANRKNVDATVGNFREFSETLKTELPKIAEKINRLADNVDSVVTENRANVTESMANIKEISAKLRTSADNLNEISGKIARGEGSIGKLVNDETTVDNLNQTLKSVESGVESLKNTIGRTERWRLNINLRSEALPELSQPANSRSTIGFDLATSPVRFFRLEFVDSPFPRVYTSTETRTTLFPDGHRETTSQAVVKTSGKNTVNAQIGYLFYGTILRAGLFESTGGVGVDRAIAKDKLFLTLEAYDWTREEHAPHLRLEGRWYLNKNLFAFAGWDDPVWRERSSYLIGAGVTWGDEDLKYLLGTAAAAAPR
jgi:phospholipid/cholesterol/gamma-HCH transport system substrate-binding protein